jgi:hypothetical protein
MRTFQSEARRLIRKYDPTAPPVDRLGEALWWVLFTRTQGRRRGHGKPWRQRAVHGGTYGPRRRGGIGTCDATSAPSPVVASRGTTDGF